MPTPLTLAARQALTYLYALTPGRHVAVSDAAPGDPTTLHLEIRNARGDVQGADPSRLRHLAPGALLGGLLRDGPLLRDAATLTAEDSTAMLKAALRDPLLGAVHADGLRLLTVPDRVAFMAAPAPAAALWLGALFGRSAGTTTLEIERGQHLPFHLRMWNGSVPVPLDLATVHARLGPGAARAVLSRDPLRVLLPGPTEPFAVWWMNAAVRGHVRELARATRLPPGSRVPQRVCFSIPPEAVPKPSVYQDGS